jgi:TolA-binding protein
MFKKTILVFCLTTLPAISYAFVDVTVSLEQSKATIKDYITSGKDAEVAGAYQKLVTDFAGNPLISTAAYEIAEAYRDNSKFSQSLEVYKDVVNKWPNSGQAVWAQRGIVVSNIALDRITDAQAETEKLLQQYAGDPNLAAAVADVGGAYHWFKKYAQADAINELVLKNWPDSESALWAKMNLVTSKIATGKYSDAETIKDSLIAKFATNPKLPEALYYIAGSYEYSKKYEKAKSIYSQIASQFPASSQAGGVPFTLAKIDVLAGIESEKADALSAIDGLVADFSSRPDLPWVLSGPIAERLYDKGLGMEADSAGQRHPYLQKAADIWEMVAKQSPSLTNTADGYSWAGHCYRELGQYAKAIECYQKVVDNFPEHRLASNDLFLIGRCNEDMKKSGLIPESEANLKIKAAYKLLLEKYPNCKAAGIAQDWLNKNQDKKALIPFLRSK